MIVSMGDAVIPELTETERAGWGPSARRSQASATGCVAPRRGGTFTTDLQAVRGRRGAVQAAGLAEDSVRWLPRAGAQPWLRAGCRLTLCVRRRLLALVRGEGGCGDRWS